ncbi:MAG: Lrp/AsnC family transcriptional regulator [Pseudomonadota bacterium]
MALDDTDRTLLTALQRDARLTNHELGELLHLSASQAGRRRQALENAGVVQGYRARLHADRVDLSVQAFVQVVMASHNPEHASEFLRHCHASREIVSVWSLTGDADYLLRIYCRDLARFNRVLQQELLQHRAVSRVHSQVVLDQVKDDAALPI